MFPLFFEHLEAFESNMFIEKNTLTFTFTFMSKWKKACRWEDQLEQPDIFDQQIET